MKILCIIGCILFSLSVRGQFVLEGKIRTLRPLTITVTDLEGKKVVECQVKSNQEFKTKPVNIRTDLYNVRFGEYSEQMILTNGRVKINGFLDDKNPQNSSMEFEGLDLYMKYLDISAVIKEKRYKRDCISLYTRDTTLDPALRAALMYTKKIFLGHDYEPFKEALDQIPGDQRESLVVKELVREVEKRAKIALGSKAYDFVFVDPDGKEVKLSDFKGKLVLLDFWASWCGPCRREMKSLLPIYQDLEGEDLVFVSISLDNKEKDWRRLMAEEKLPWVMLWNKEGFTIGDKPNAIQEAYGFYQIPFIVLIGKDGKVIARGLRGDKVREAIQTARK